MASDNSTKSTFPADVRVKIEPGTSASSTSFTPSESLPHIKTEPNTQPAPVQRLTSFRVPRDLTLGGNIKLEKPKKVYTPNVNVQRNKNKNEPLPPKVKHELVRNSDRGRGRGRGNRGRGERGRGKPKIIESTGVWSEGIYVPPVSRKYSSDGGSDSVRVRYSEKPKKLNKVTDTDKTKEAETERLMKLVLRNDDSDEDEEADERVQPLSLPRGNQNLSRIKKDKINVENKASDMPDENKARTIPEMIENKSNSYVLIQLPDCLPGSLLESSKEETEPGKSSNSNDDDEDDDNAKAERCTLGTLKEGRLGTLEVLKSGRTRLRIGNMYFSANTGSQLKCRQDLMAIKLDNTASSTSDTVNLGSIDGKLIISPDLSQILEDFDFT
ncbi:DNA-directed RNA polymerase III subunit RPC4 [Ooceraea biroi]|uniref:DNA-directed RNA polymerase III subunit RPC4 n=1 Tax=Ooceraea biroi TaxID=2015173 RepID=A0A026WYA9_OOCBI|nr:DNA-directed RNA polymerase III subunit RPC4 [Ooceraea biroi]